MLGKVGPVILAMLAATAVHAADRLVKLVVPPPVAAGIAAMPLIADPADDAERRIDTALGRLDGTVRKAAAACKADGGKDSDWQRTVDAPMRGPGFLSFTITDNLYCGGAHPDSATMAIVYDLRTGAPVDWTKLLPSSLTGTVALDTGADGTRMVTLASAKLWSLYRAAYPPPPDPDDARLCQEALQTAGASGPPRMMTWLDAKAGGLGVSFDVAHAEQACVEPYTVPTATLRQLGADSRLVDALETAHRSR